MMGIDDASSMACTGEMVAHAAAASRGVHFVLDASDRHLWPAPLTGLSTVCDVVSLSLLQRVWTISGGGAPGGL